MKFTVRISQGFYEEMIADLSRPHPFAYERIGFLFFRHGISVDGVYLILPTQYMKLSDDQYIDDPKVGARINNQAIHNVMQHILDTSQGVLHVHSHDHRGRPLFSKVDNKEIPPLIKAFHHLGIHNGPHGALVLSKDDMSGWAWMPNSNKAWEINQFAIVGYPLRFFGGCHE